MRIVEEYFEQTAEEVEHRLPVTMKVLFAHLAMPIPPPIEGLRPRDLQCAVDTGKSINKSPVLAAVSGKRTVLKRTVNLK